MDLIKENRDKYRLYAMVMFTILIDYSEDSLLFSTPFKVKKRNIAR